MPPQLRIDSLSMDLDPPSSKQEVKEDDQDDEVDTAAAIIADAGAHVVSTATEE